MCVSKQSTGSNRGGAKAGCSNTASLFAVEEHAIAIVSQHVAAMEVTGEDGVEMLFPHVY
jgi:hypothetical protein